MTSSVPPPRIRIDKWLWAVRIFKTRSLAHHAIEAGHIRLNDERIKPSHSVAIGDRIDILQGSRSLTIVVDSVTSIRSSAPIAQTHRGKPSAAFRRKNLKCRDTNWRATHETGPAAHRSSSRHAIENAHHDAQLKGPSSGNSAAYVTG